MSTSPEQRERRKNRIGRKNEKDKAKIPRYKTIYLNENDRFCSKEEAVKTRTVLTKDPDKTKPTVPSPSPRTGSGTVNDPWIEYTDPTWKGKLKPIYLDARERFCSKAEAVLIRYVPTKRSDKKRDEQVEQTERENKGSEPLLAYGEHERQSPLQNAQSELAALPLFSRVFPRERDSTLQEATRTTKPSARTETSEKVFAQISGVRERAAQAIEYFPDSEKRKRRTYGVNEQGIKALGRLLRQLRENTNRADYEHLLPDIDEKESDMSYRPKRKRKTAEAIGYLRLEDVSYLSGISRNVLQALERPPVGKTPNWYVINQLLSTVDYIKHEDGTPYLLSELFHLTLGETLPIPAAQAASELVYKIAKASEGGGCGSGNDIKEAKQIPLHFGLRELSNSESSEWEAVSPIGNELVLCRYQLSKGVLSVTPLRSLSDFDTDTSNRSNEKSESAASSASSAKRFALSI